MVGALSRCSHVHCCSPVKLSSLHYLGKEVLTFTLTRFCTESSAASAATQAYARIHLTSAAKAVVPQMRARRTAEGHKREPHSRATPTISVRPGDLTPVHTVVIL